MQIQELLKIDKNNIEQSFRKIALTFINEVNLVINGFKYEFVDFEFYYYSEEHPDEYTFQHKISRGRFHGHRYGLDIALDNQKNQYGGILLKGLMSSSDQRFIPKNKIKNEIFNHFELGENQVFYQEKALQQDYKILLSQREHLGKEKTANKLIFKPKKYRFIRYEEDIWQNLKNKRRILEFSEKF